MTDLATLSFSIDSTQAATASQNLDRLRGSTEQATAAHKNLSQQSLDTQHSLGGMTDISVQLKKQIDTTVTSFDTLIGKMKEARAAFDGSAASFKQWDVATAQVDGLGRAFGTTARGLDAYNQAASQLGFSSQQTAQSLQRITLALENQTAVGAQLRTVMNEYGVSLSGLKIDQADEALRRLQTRFSQVADTAKRTRDIQSVLGTLDPDAMSAIVSPNYVPIQQRREQDISRTSSLNAERMYSAARDIERPVQQQRQQLSDLESNLPGGTALDGRSLYRSSSNQKDLALFQRNAPEGSQFLQDGTRSTAGRIALLQQVMGANLHPEAANPLPGDYNGQYSMADELGGGTQPMGPQYGPEGTAAAGNRLDRMTGDDLRDAAMRARGRGGVLGSVKNLFSDENGTSMLSRAYAHLTDGGYGAVSQLNGANNDADYSAGKIGMFGYAGRSIGGFFNNVTNQNLPTLPAAPVVSPMDEIGQANALAGFGDVGLLRYQQSDKAMRGFGRQAGDSGIPGQDGADDVGGDALAAFSVYGKDAQQELNSRRSSLSTQRRNALRPGGAAVDQANQELSVSRFSLGDQGKARAFMAFVQGRGGDTTQLQGQSLDDMLDPSGSGGGNISPQLVRDFNQSYGTNQQASNAQFTTQSNQRTTDLAVQAGSASYGPNGVQDMATYQQAYNKALGETTDETERLRRADEALKEVQAQRLVQSNDLISNMERQNKISADSNAATAGGGYDPLTYGANKVTAGINASYTAENARLGGTLNPTSYKAGRAGAIGNEAVAGSQDTLAGGAQELQNAQKLLQVSDQRTAFQTQFNRELQVELSFQQDLIKARAADGIDGGDRVKQIQAAIEAMKELKNETAQANAEAKAYKLGNDATQAGQDLRARFSLPRSQRGLFDAELPAFQHARDDQTMPNAMPAGMYGPPASGGGLGGMTIGRGPIPMDQRAAILQAATAGTPIQPALMNGLFTQESGWDPSRQRQGGSDLGLGQITASTGARPGFNMAPISRSDAADPVANATWTTHYLYERGKAAGLTDADWTDTAKVTKALQAYNGGGDPNYAQNVLRYVPGAMSGGASAMNAEAGGYASHYQAQNDTQAQDLREQDAIRARGESAALPFIRSGRSADATLARQGNFDDGDPNGAQKAAIAQGQTLQGLQTQFAATQSQTDLATASNTKLAAAYRDGGKAIGEMTDKLKVEAETRQSNLSPSQQSARLKQLTDERTSAQGLTLSQQTHSQDQSNSLDQLNLSLGPFASPKQVASAMGEAQAKQYADNNLSNLSQSDQDSYIAGAKATAVLKEQVTETQKVRDGFTQMGDAAFSTFNGVLLNGGKAKDVIASFTKEIAGMLLQMSETPIKNALGGQATSGLNSLGSFFGFGGGGADAVATEASLFGATGRAYAGGVRFLASGGILDRPTRFLADGGVTTAGEVGNEAVMPLKRMANGNLGIISSGGSGGGVQVHAPITITGSSAVGSNGKMDPAVAAQLQAHVEETVRQAVVGTIANEQRPGGSLYR